MSQRGFAEASMKKVSWASRAGCLGFRPLIRKFTAKAQRSLFMFMVREWKSECYTNGDLGKERPTSLSKPPEALPIASRTSTLKGVRRERTTSKSNSNNPLPDSELSDVAAGRPRSRREQNCDGRVCRKLVVKTFTG